MNRLPQIEVEDTLTYSQMSNEIGSGQRDLIVTVMFRWDYIDGMSYEPIAYHWKGRDHKMSGRRNPVGLEEIVTDNLADEITEEHLDNILREHPAFEQARNHEFDLLDLDRVEYMDAVF